MPELTITTTSKVACDLLRIPGFRLVRTEHGQVHDAVLACPNTIDARRAAGSAGCIIYGA